MNLEGEAPLPMSRLCGREPSNLHVDALLDTLSDTLSEETPSPDASFKSQPYINLSHGKRAGLSIGSLTLTHSPYRLPMTPTLTPYSDSSLNISPYANL